MSEFTAPVLDQLRAAKHEVEAQIAVLTDERDLIDQAIAVLDRGVERRGDEPVGATAAVAAPLSDDRSNGMPSDVTPEQVLEHIGSEWMTIGPICSTLGIGKEAVRRRIRKLVSDGLIEVTGERAGTRYRRVGSVVTTTPPSDDPELDISPLRPQPGRDLAGKIEAVLGRADGPVSAAALAKSLVLPLDEVAHELRHMVTLSERGHRYPPIHRDAEGGYSLGLERAA